MRASGAGSAIQNHRLSHFARPAKIVTDRPQPFLRFINPTVNGAIRHPLRVGIKSLWLAAELMWIAINYISRTAFRNRRQAASEHSKIRQPLSRARKLETRAQWPGRYLAGSRDELIPDSAFSNLSFTGKV
jgi:hypothetical protein